MTTQVRASGAVARAIAILADLVAFDTTSGNGNLALMRYIEGLLAEHGIAAELVPEDSGRKTNLFATLGPARPDGVILSGHTDGVPVAGQQWTSDPFQLTEREGRLYGRGTANMKAFIACSLAALDHADIATLERPVHLALYDDEVGCLGAAGPSSALTAVALVGEPSRMRIIGSRKGVYIYKASVTGVPAHSSAVHLGLSANSFAIRLMNILVRIADGLSAEDMRNPDFHPPFSTLTIGLMQGGTAADILAAEANFVFDLRCLPEHDPDEILAPFHAEIDAIRAAHPRVTITCEPQAAVPPLISDGKAEEFVRLIVGDNSEMATASYGAEAGQLRQGGWATVICGPGAIDQAYQPDEFIEIGEIEKCMIFMDRLFAALSRPAVAA